METLPATVLEETCTPFTNRRRVVPSKVSARCVHAFEVSGAAPEEVGLLAGLPGAETVEVEEAEIGPPPGHCGG